MPRNQLLPREAGEAAAQRADGGGVGRHQKV
jgi:hypothetical protein